MGFEPMVEVLQTSALPLGYGAMPRSAASVYHTAVTGDEGAKGDEG